MGVEYLGGSCASILLVFGFLSSFLPFFLPFLVSFSFLFFSLPFQCFSHPPPIFYSLYVIFSEVDCEGPVQSSFVLFFSLSVSFPHMIFFSQVYGYTSLGHVEPVWKAKAR
ncbi:hypothetical protein BO94DRAFT_354079 [Aspergillus sclerotioniger CBS 115572]|uniref:Uncharacterized protein n=1 Tax=Aspergillus sclerotioniger CBS 115572 TaxID=1450535 RepID=A0A317X840_9EURO|nr:hypothetical protein BO94DRAFT_354079 [Aspergillus sclerotioniger CBS 115572]PWY93822.1 hypothetical protein BO94DRAFT_354079 [Aspergillus sclerotioniger CBS 115572]